MEQERYITREESARCKLVRDAFAELYDEDDVIVLDAGRYGFIELQYFNGDSEFSFNRVFADSRKLFEELWENWLDVQLLRFAEGTPIAEMDYEDIFKILPQERQDELMEKRKYFAGKAGISLDGE